MWCRISCIAASLNHATKMMSEQLLVYAVLPIAIETYVVLESSYVGPRERRELK